MNAYTLTFAVLLLTGAVLGDRVGRRRLLAIGLAIFTGGSALAALAASANELIVARAIHSDRRRRSVAHSAAPAGAYPVGTRSIELVDRSRREPGTNGRRRRSFVMQLWYPRAPGDGKRERYMPPPIAAFLGASSACPR